MKKLFMVLFLGWGPWAALAGEPPQDFSELPELAQEAYQVIFGIEANTFYGYHCLVPSEEIRKNLEERLEELKRESNQSAIAASLAVLYKLWPVENTATAEELEMAQSILARLNFTTPEND
jgi:hypothetical protein